jgi:hypothetical protein
MADWFYDFTRNNLGKGAATLLWGDQEKKDALDSQVAEAQKELANSYSPEQQQAILAKIQGLKGQLEALYAKQGLTNPDGTLKTVDTTTGLAHDNTGNLTQTDLEKNLQKQGVLDQNGVLQPMTQSGYQKYIDQAKLDRYGNEFKGATDNALGKGYQEFRKNAMVGNKSGKLAEIMGMTEGLQRQGNLNYGQVLDTEKNNAYNKAMTGQALGTQMAGNITSEAYNRASQQRNDLMTNQQQQMNYANAINDQNWKEVQNEVSTQLSMMASRGQINAGQLANAQNQLNQMTPGLVQQYLKNVGTNLGGVLTGFNSNDKNPAYQKDAQGNDTKNVDILGTIGKFLPMILG